MSILLSHLKSYDTKTRESSQNVQTTKGTTATNQLTRVSSGREFTQGEILQGEVIDLRSNQATIRLSDGSVVQGKMEQEVDLYIGQTATFEVAKTTDAGVQLKIIPEQETNPIDQLIGKALIQAGLPLSPKNKEVVGALLEANLSVDKQSIQSFLKIAYQYPDAEIKDLVFLHKHNLPVDQNQLNLLQEYHNSEHRIVTQLQSLVSGLGEMLSDGNQPELILKFLQLALQVPEYVEGQVSHGDVLTGAVGQQQNGEAVTGTAGQQQNGEAVTGAAGQQQNGEAVTGAVGQQQNGEAVTGAVGQQQNGEAVTGAAGQQLNGEAMNTAGSQQGAETSMKSISIQFDANANAQFSSSTSLGQLMTEQQLQSFASDLQHAGMPDSIVKQVREGNITGHEVLEAVFEFAESNLTGGKPSSALKELMESVEFQHLYKEELIHKYTLTPNQLANGENIDKLYEKLEQDIDQLNHLLSNRSGNEEASKLLGQTEHLKNNLDFMKTLNQIYPYIQLPVCLKDQKLHSELFVFTKRRGSMIDADNVRVLLHLDMEHLGALDIHLQLNKNHLKAKFYVEEEGVKELFEHTIDELSDALAEKGYQVSSEFYHQEKHTDPLETIESQELISEGRTMKRYTFDVRA